MAEEIDFEIRHFLKFKSHVTLTLTSDDLESHIVVNVSLTSNFEPADSTLVMGNRNQVLTGSKMTFLYAVLVSDQTFFIPSIYVQNLNA